MSHEPEPRPSRRREILTLDIPLVLGLILCTTLTFVEASRAAEGNGRALAYTFQWPLIGAFIVWIWYRYRIGIHRKTASQSGADERPKRRGITNHYREQVAAAQAAQDESDAQLQAWQQYVDDLQRRDPPGQPPAEGPRG